MYVVVAFTNRDLDAPGGYGAEPSKSLLLCDSDQFGFKKKVTCCSLLAAETLYIYVTYILHIFFIVFRHKINPSVFL